MNTVERDKLINETGIDLAEKLKGFYGKVHFHIQAGKYGHAIVEESIKLVVETKGKPGEVIKQ